MLSQTGLSATLIPGAEFPPTEVEAKFTIQNPALLQNLAVHPAPVPGYRFHEQVTKHIEDVYIDTSDYWLLRQGYQLRVRSEGDDWQAALKSRGVASEVGIYQRLEVEGALAAADLPLKLSDLPESIADALTDLVGKRTDLEVICALRQTRRLRNVSSEAPGRKHDNDSALMQLYLDEIQIRSVDNQPILAHAYEVEVELTLGVDLAELQVLADRFMGTHGLVPSTDSKLERALRIISRHPADSPEDWQGIGPELHMGEACRIIWHEQFMTLLLNEAGVRYSSDPEYVHAARVAIRRARAAARLYKDYFRPKGIRRYLKLMRKTAQLLGAVRDLDVAIAKLLSYQKKSKRKAAGDLQHTLDGWMKKRADAHRDLVAWFDTKEYGEFVCDFLRFCRTPGAEILDLQPQTGVQVPPFQVRHVVPSMLLDNFAHVRCYEVCFEQGNDVQLPTLHQLRIECKYLRYNLEFVRDLLGDDSNGIIVDLKKLQDDLGDLNDAVVSKELLSDTGDGSNNDGLARYESAQNKAISKLRKQTYADFARFVGPENRARLLAAIANL